jgi:hypothetical protein
MFGSRWGYVEFLTLLIGSHIKVPLPFDFLPHGFYTLCLHATQKSIKLNFYFVTELAKNVSHFNEYTTLSIWKKKSALYD